ncbi:MAG: Ig-like domain-containing protein [Gemmatimonadota bacterium]
MDHDSRRSRSSLSSAFVPGRATLAAIAVLAFSAVLAGCGDEATGPSKSDPSDPSDPSDAPESPELPGPPASLVLSADTVHLAALGAADRLSATVADSNGIAIGDATVEWSSADEAVATVNADGRVVAEANGRAVVTAAVGEITDEAAVVVEQVVAAVEVTPAADTIGQHGVSELAAEARDANGVAIPDAAVAWSTSDPARVPVNGGGQVTSAYWGLDATITATVDGESVSAEVHVLDQIAFVSSRHGNLDIDLVNADGSDRRRLTSASADETMPAWSPDGRRLAFVSPRDGDREIWIMEADGSNPVRVTDDPEEDVRPARRSWPTPHRSAPG